MKQSNVPLQMTVLRVAQSLAMLTLLLARLELFAERRADTDIATAVIDLSSLYEKHRK